MSLSSPKEQKAKLIQLFDKANGEKKLRERWDDEVWNFEVRNSRPL